MIYLHFRYYPRQREINERHRHIPGDFRPRTQLRFQPWPRESPFVTGELGCTSARGVMVLTTVITFVSIYLRSCSWLLREKAYVERPAGTMCDHAPKDREGRSRQNDGNRTQVGTKKHFPENIQKTHIPHHHADD